MDGWDRTDGGGWNGVVVVVVVENANWERANQQGPVINQSTAGG